MTLNILPYVYKATDKYSGKYYIGVRWANKVPAIHDIGIRYFSSSPKIKENSTNFNWEVLKEFDDKFTAFEFEQSLIRENKKDPKILNNFTGEEFITSDLISWSNTNGVNVKTLYSSKTHNTNRNWFLKRLDKNDTID